MTFEETRGFALSLPGVIEQPHFDKLSWRTGGKIFATVPPEQSHLHIFVEEGEIKPAVEEAPDVFEELWWGKKLVGVRILLEKASPGQVMELLQEAWSLRAPAALKAQIERP